LNSLENRTLLTQFDITVLDINVQVSVYQTTYTPGQIWETRDQWLTFTEKSKEYYNAMTQEEREGRQEIIKYAMQRLYDKIDVWFPDSIDMSSGSAIDVHFRVLVTDAQEAIKKHSGMTEMMIAEAERESLALLSKFDSN
jgi:hypothetical protein